MNAKTFLAERFLKHRTLCWSISDIKLSFLPSFCRIFDDFVQNFVVFVMFLWDFLMILDSGENCVRSVSWHFRCFFWQLLGHSCTSAVCPRSFLCAWCQKLHCRALRTSVRSAQICIFLVFPAFLSFSEEVRTWSLFLQKWMGHGRQNSNDVCDIV